MITLEKIAKQKPMTEDEAKLNATLQNLPLAAVSGTVQGWDRNQGAVGALLGPAGVNGAVAKDTGKVDLKIL